MPTFLVNVEGVPAEEVAARLADAQIGVWAHDSWYSLNLYKRLGYDGKSVRIGFIHYNTADEVDRLIEALEGRAARASPARSGGRAMRRGRVGGRRLPAPLRISASLLRLMLPPETTHDDLPVPARPVRAAAARGARTLGDHPDPLGERAHGGGDVVDGDRQGASTSGATSGHMLSSTRRLPEPSTNEGL